MKEAEERSTVFSFFSGKVKQIRTSPECHVNCRQSTNLMLKSVQKPVNRGDTGQGVIFDHANKTCAV